MTTLTKEYIDNLHVYEAKTYKALLSITVDEIGKAAPDDIVGLLRVWNDHSDDGSLLFALKANGSACNAKEIVAEEDRKDFDAMLALAVTDYVVRRTGKPLGDDTTAAVEKLRAELKGHNA